MKLHKRKGVFSILNQIETAAKSLISKLKYAKTDLLKSTTKQSIFTTVTSVSLAFAIAGLSVSEVFGAYESFQPKTEAAAESVEERTEEIEIVLSTRYGTQPELTAVSYSLDEIVEGYEVFVDGTSVGKVSERGKEKILEEMNRLLSEVKTEGTAEIYQNVTFEKGLFDGTSIVASNTVLSRADLKVVEILQNTEVKELEFETVFKDSDKLGKGEFKVETEGKNGSRTTTTEIMLIDGEIISKEVVSQETVEPVDKVVLNGSRPVADISASRIEALGGVAFPLGNASCYVSSAFGYRSFDDSFHNGIDYAADYGTAVYSALEGKVVFAGWDNTGYGNYVVIEHDGKITTCYAHMAEIYVSDGETVEAGQCIGAVGSTGYSTGNHLHFSVKADGQFTNPAQLF